MGEKFSSEQMAEFMKHDSLRDSARAAEAAKEVEPVKAEKHESMGHEFVLDEESGELVNPEKVAESAKTAATLEKVKKDLDSLFSGEELPIQGEEIVEGEEIIEGEEIN